jgi:tetratricopeptide (TPR) repeat protein
MTARALVEAGDREKALQAIESALAIDPNFLAAHDLRASILSTPARVVPKRDDVVKRAHPPLVSTESYPKVEQRVKRRRVDREVNEAQAALHDGRLKEAAAALAQITELDPNSPELKELTAQLDVLRRLRPPARPGRWFAATAAVGGLVLGALYVFQAIQPMPTPADATTSRVSLPDPVDTTAALPARTDSATEPVTGGIGSTPVTGVMTPVTGVIQRLRPASSIAAGSQCQLESRRRWLPHDQVPSLVCRLRAPCSGVTPDPGIVVRCVDTNRGAAASAPAVAVPACRDCGDNRGDNCGSTASASASIVPTAMDEEQVKEVLDRYRQAYEASLRDRCAMYGRR